MRFIPPRFQRTDAVLLEIFYRSIGRGVVLLACYLDDRKPKEGDANVTNFAITKRPRTLRVTAVNFRECLLKCIIVPVTMHFGSIKRLYETFERMGLTKVKRRNHAAMKTLREWAVGDLSSRMCRMFV